MPISPIGVAGLGVQMAGGIAGALGQNRRSDAFTRAAGMSVDSARNLRGANTATRQFFQPQFDELPGQRAMGLNELISALGPERNARLASGVGEAGQLQEQALGELDTAIGPQPAPWRNQSAGMTAGLAARRQLSARAAPGRRLQALRLAHAGLAPGDASAEGAFSDRIADLVRRSGDIQSAQGLRQALVGRQFGASQQSFLDALARAQTTGVGLGAVGQLAGNIGGAMTQHTAFPVEQINPMIPVLHTAGAGYENPEVY